MNKESKTNITVTVDVDGFVTNYKYQVIFVDEYNNFYHLGFFNDLKDAEPELNAYLEDYEAYDETTGDIVKIQFGDAGHLGHLREYPSTFSSCFDTIIDTTCGCVQIRGFIFN